MPRRSCQGDLVRGSCQDTSFWRSCAKTLHRDLSQRSCQEVSYINPHKSCQENSSRELVQRFQKEIWHRDMVWTGDLLKSCQEAPYRDLAKKPHTQILPGHLFWRPCLVQRHCIEVGQSSCQEDPYRDLAKRPLIESSRKDLARTAAMETLYRSVS